MNSLPFISHHLFVAAVANESRSQERPVRRDRSIGDPLDRPSMVPLEKRDSRERMMAMAARAPRESIAHVPA